MDLLTGVENDAEFLEMNPVGFIPAIRDGDVAMVESVAIIKYLLGRYGPMTLAPGAQDAAFPAYRKLLDLGEAGLATTSISFQDLGTSRLKASVTIGVRVRRWTLAPSRHAWRGCASAAVISGVGGVSRFEGLVDELGSGSMT